MKQNLWKAGLLGLATLAFMGCESDNDMGEVNPKIKTQEMVAGTCDVIDFESAPVEVFISEVYSKTGMGPITVYNKARDSKGVMGTENRGAIYDTRKVTGDDEDLYTSTWGNVLIIQEVGKDPYNDPNVERDGPNDNQWGGEMSLTFPKEVVLESMNVLDMDVYEDDSWVYLYNGKGEEIFKAKLQPLGNNSRQTVNFGNTAGVRELKVVLAGTSGFTGSAAIDDIKFCVPAVPTDDVVKGCTRTQGYWKNHADPKKKQYDSAWNNYLGVDFYGMGTYLDVLKRAPKGGDANIILAHQFIAAELNVAAGASMPANVREAWLAAQDYFKGKRNATRSELIAWAELLDNYNNGKVGPGHCDG
ncbi:MAG TPA: hypothetical protein VIG72_02645 [Pontibacter sp.]